ncbi:ribonuclease HI [Pelagibacteraceae bacterium]|nr:ribonuclease HI [Pelagibacteraceae bacterium]
MIKIYTDGACSGNPGKGGWAAVILNGNSIEKISGSAENTTNNRMELMALISALKFVKDQNLEIFTDSKYAKDGIEKWIINWKKNGWKTSNKEDVKNKDLWIELDKLNEQKEIKWTWVKGHAGDKYNSLADELARSQSKS